MLNGLAAQQMDFAIWQYLAPPHMSSGHIKSGPAFGFAHGFIIRGGFTAQAECGGGGAEADAAAV